MGNHHNLILETEQIENFRALEARINNLRQKKKNKEHESGKIFQIPNIQHVTYSITTPVSLLNNTITIQSAVFQTFPNTLDHINGDLHYFCVIPKDVISVQNIKE